jgi:hypothetical protein
LRRAGAVCRTRRDRGALVRAGEAWSLLLSLTARVLYAGLCSFLGHGEVNRKDLRNALKNCSDAEVISAFAELVHRNLLAPKPVSRGGLASYAVSSVQGLEN